MVALLVAMMFIMLVLVDLILRKAEVHRAARVGARNGLERWIAIPEGVYLYPGHAWTLPLQEGTVRAGADSFVAGAIGSASGVVLPEVGQWVEAGKPLCRLEVGGRTLTIPSPVSGRIAAVNHSLKGRPELLAAEPYGRGWVCSVEQVRPQGHTVYFGQAATLWLQREVDRFREFLSALYNPEFELGLTSQDGGLPMPGVLAQSDASALAAFEHEFIRRR